MPDTTPRLTLPVLLPNQAQKHVTHNEALLLLDALVQTGLTACGSQTPPADPADGMVHALGDTPTGDWAGQAGRLAIRQNGGWAFVDPQVGWRGWDLSEDRFKVFDGSAWVPVVDLSDQPGLGIETTWDSVNRLAVASEASLFSHAGAGHQLKINKAATGDTAALLFQSGFAGRAELGLAGSDAFSLKVSDGGPWTEVLRTDAASGRVTVPNGIGFGGDTLTHYEEGSFTPTLAIGGTGTGITYTTQEGHYTRVGRLVSLQVGIRIASRGGLTGDVTVTGLPFEAVPSYYPGNLFPISGFTGLTGAVTCRIVPGPALYLAQQTPTGVTPLTDAHLTASANFKCSLVFTV